MAGRGHPAAAARWTLAGLAPGLLAGALQSHAAGAAAASSGTGAPFPDFHIEPCCELCPAAADPAAYNTNFLRSFRILMQGEGGWLFRSEDDLMTSFGPDEWGLQQLRRLRESLLSRGVELVLVIQPPRGLMHRHRMGPDLLAGYNWQLAQFSYVHTLQELRKAGFVVPDLERLVYEGGGDDFFFRADHHWTPDGARRTAEVVAERIRRMPQYADLPRKSFVTTRDGLLAKRGTMDKAAMQLCGVGAAEQYVQRFVTVPDDGGDAGALLDESPTPPITLIGTSNSDPAYNFAGFLQEMLEVDVLNAAVVGGGLDGAPLSYLPSPEFREHPPKILVWEIEPYHNLSDEIFYRRVIPVVEGGCAGGAVLTDERTLRAGTNEVLFNGGGHVRQLRSADHLLSLRFEARPASSVNAVVWYTNGSNDEFKIADSNIDASGRYVVELRRDGGYADFTFLSLDIKVRDDEPRPLRVESRLCRRAGPRGASVASSESVQ